MASSVSTRIEKTDTAFLNAALNLAARGLGSVAPNPAVGCILVNDGRVVGRGWTQPGGRPHAETEALRQAGSQAQGACAYVTLEPCAHHGRTPPCADALIEAGISRCVVALQDPDERVQGQGIARLRAAGVEVSLGLCADAASETNEGFLRRVTEGRPLVTLKIASTLDGRIATHSGESQWITGPKARVRGHLMRASHDAIMVGSGTALTDNPRLDVRLPGLTERSPLRIVIDRRLRLPLQHDLVVRAKEQPTLLVTKTDSNAARLQGYRDAGVEVLETSDGKDEAISLAAVLQSLGRRGITRLLVESGGTLAGSLFAADLVDRIAWFRSGGVIGGDGMPAVSGFGLDRLKEMPKFSLRSSIALAEDRLEVFHRRNFQSLGST
ncbi:bifunctional diaminohydroxyphosphoribosylaminopyrimidine deaminase/5-amino-6-(5-phosphoribosylamino)uracil reductase RibD [Pelagibius sp. Alg239-R121]|uniref:bifunctional diaminohydroxyphosphoribosylaminopyrimidine deaminase/5-amino-6-(5-phosphoribosylamino)uracil reductase RibD n=1 Tax=Pelagibius sp. Alg239-R121 TaxID=2993448 RepID=UPI0024A63CE2|nr:bifunctional diaminohydroxyphosphoribosylaminopyrimidine deaminase/5-amino-6-(5-phosphoribosylamino)uracil reductase RibD [Pelagibius sp. Alg239-R121]